MKILKDIPKMYKTGKPVAIKIGKAAGKAGAIAAFRILMDKK